MSRLAIPARDDVPEASKPILDAVQKQLGVVPNMFRLTPKARPRCRDSQPTTARSQRRSTSRRASGSRWPSRR